MTKPEIELLSARDMREELSKPCELHGVKIMDCHRCEALELARSAVEQLERGPGGPDTDDEEGGAQWRLLDAAALLCRWYYESNIADDREYETGRASLKLNDKWLGTDEEG